MKKMKKIVISRIIVQFVLTSAWLINFGVDLIAYLVLYALLAFQYIIEINILKCENCSKKAIALIVADLLLVNYNIMIPIDRLHLESYYMIPIVLVNVLFASYILTQLLEKREITMSQRVVMKRIYNVCTIVFLILLFAAAIAALIAFIVMLFGEKLMVFGLILIPILAVVTYKLTFIARSLQKRYAEYVLNAKRLWVPSLIIIVHIVINVGMIFACWLAWFGALFLLACANGYHG